VIADGSAGAVWVTVAGGKCALLGEGATLLASVCAAQPENSDFTISSSNCSYLPGDAKLVFIETLHSRISMVDIAQAIPDFNSAERWVIESALKERYGRLAQIELADSELKLDPDAPVLTACPTVFWSERGCNFVIFKTAEDRFRSLFYYSDEELYGTGRSEYDELAECVSLLLKLQADHEKQRQGVQSGMTGGEIN
jgi:hypothetical protein